MNKRFLIDEHICLRALEPTDFPFLYTIENDPEMWDISNFTVPYSRYALEQYILSNQSDMFADKQLRLIIMRLSDREPVGIIDVSDFVPLHSRGAVGVAIRKEFRRQGYGSAALRLLCDYAFDFLHFKQLYAFVVADNESSKHLFISQGFVQSGRLTDWLSVDGEYKDALIFQSIR
jgi:diamine N-acetyltransferase